VNGAKITAEEMHRTHERELIVRALRRRADRREQSLTTAAHAQEVCWCRRLADDIASGFECVLNIFFGETGDLCGLEDQFGLIHFCLSFVYEGCRFRAPNLRRDT